MQNVGILITVPDDANHFFVRCCVTVEFKIDIPDDIPSEWTLMMVHEESCQLADQVL